MIFLFQVHAKPKPDYLKTEKFVNLKKALSAPLKDPSMAIMSLELESEIKKLKPEDWKEVLPLVLDSLKAKDENTRMGATCFLLQAAEFYTEKEVVRNIISALKTNLNSENKWLALRTAYALGVYGDETGEAKLLKYVSDNDEDVSYKAILYLGSIGKRSESVLKLSKLLETSDEDKRRAAILSISEMSSRSKKAAEVLVKLLNDPDPKKRLFVIENSIVNKLPKEIFNHYISSLDEKDEQVRNAASLQVTNWLANKLSALDFRDITKGKEFELLELFSKDEINNILNKIPQKLIESESNLLFQIYVAYGEYEKAIKIAKKQEADIRKGNLAYLYGVKAARAIRDNNLDEAIYSSKNLISYYKYNPLEKEIEQLGLKLGRDHLNNVIDSISRKVTPTTNILQECNEAEQAFSSILNFGYENDKARYGKGLVNVIKAYLGNKEAITWGINDLEKVVMQNPENGAAHYYLGYLYSIRNLPGDKSQANLEFMHAIKYGFDGKPYNQGLTLTKMD